MGHADGFGVLLRKWRTARGLSQLELTLRAETTPRHLSFLETGRSRPSEAMIDRLADALGLGAGAADELRLAAGYAARSAGDGAFASRLFETTLALTAAKGAEALIDVSQPLRQTLGMDHCFFATVTRESGRYAIDFHNYGGMPDGWLRRYKRRRYSRIDPFLAGSFGAGSSHRWSDAPANALFDDAAAVGIRAGHIARTRSASGAVHLVSMMGRGAGAADGRAHLGLQTLGHIMIEAFVGMEGPRPML